MQRTLGLLAALAGGAHRNGTCPQQELHRSPGATSSLLSITEPLKKESVSHQKQNLYF